MTNKLKPCPFGHCRGKARIESHRARGIKFYYVAANHDIECPLYDAILSDNIDRYLVIQRWNARWEPPERTEK